MRPVKPEPAGTSRGEADAGKNDAAAPARRERRKRKYGRWV